MSLRPFHTVQTSGASRYRLMRISQAQNLRKMENTQNTAIHDGAIRQSRSPAAQRRSNFDL